MKGLQYLWNKAELHCLERLEPGLFPWIIQICHEREQSCQSKSVKGCPLSLEQEHQICIGSTIVF